MPISYNRLSAIFRNITSLSTLATLAATATGATSACAGASTLDSSTGKEATNQRNLNALDRALGTDSGCPGEQAAPDAGDTRPGETPRASIDRTGFAASVCDGATYNPLTGITPSQPVDYISLRTRFVSATNEDVISQGTLCGTASDPAACISAVQAINPPNSNDATDLGKGWSPLSVGGGERTIRYVVTTAGDTVSTVTFLEALAVFLGPIDTAKDAALVVSQQGNSFDCSRPNARQTPEGWELITRSGHTCGADTNLVERRIVVSPTGVVTERESVIVERGNPNCAIGRRPEGFVSHMPFAYPHDDGPHNGGGENRDASLGTTFASIAELEAASVVAFERLAAELAHHGAPESLIDEAKRSAWDEVVHTAMMKDLAARFGSNARLPYPDAANTCARDLFDIALENAVEGCVRETFGALQATHQAAHATDSQVADAMRVIADDETRHAALAWDIAAWIEPQLSSEQRLALKSARDRAIDTLCTELRVEHDKHVVAVAGAPSAADARRMLDALHAQLWAA